MNWSSVRARRSSKNLLFSKYETKLKKKARKGTKRDLGKEAEEEERKKWEH
jgi:hypothetical protein